MDIRKIKTLIEMLEESNLNEIEVSQGDESVRISKGNDTKNLIESDQLNTKISNHESLSMNKDNKENLNGHQVKAPLVGTFYRKPSPESDPFIKVGDVVKKGQVLCIIEAMKMMNEIKSEFDGEVSTIEVEDGQPVEFGQTIFVIQ
tara:strand:+ start:7803 stop:8240 length:438 start_codon:yes stop_codon:yes gene_type:complete